MIVLEPCRYEKFEVTTLIVWGVKYYYFDKVVTVLRYLCAVTKSRVIGQIGAKQALALISVTCRIY